MRTQLVIIMPTYNGGNFLAEQIESIRKQTVDSWTLLVRDDGSTDGTVDRLKQYANEDKRIVLVEDNSGNLGASQSFSLLIDLALTQGADYIAFSDQDDVWKPEKLEKSLARMYELEKQYGKEKPLLVHTDLEVVTETLQTISSSFMRYENIKQPSLPSINRLLIQNYVVGCTMVANRSLAEKASPVPVEIRMHDWWLASYAVVTGILSYLPNATIQYRQHSTNTLGVAGFNQIYNPFSQAWRKRLMKRPMLQRASVRLAMALKSRCADNEKSKQLYLLAQCTNCFTLKWGWTRVICAKQAGMSGQNWVASLIFYILLLFSRFR